jgi:predicted dehydrogenase
VHSQELSVGTVDAELGTPTFSMPYGQLNHLYLRGYVPELEAFARHVRQGEPPEATIAQAYETLRVRQAIDRAAGSGGWERVAEP